jgi:hypothetical protein
MTPVALPLTPAAKVESKQEPKDKEDDIDDDFVNFFEKVLAPEKPEEAAVKDQDVPKAKPETEKKVESVIEDSNQEAVEKVSKKGGLQSSKWATEDKPKNGPKQEPKNEPKNEPKSQSKDESKKEPESEQKVDSANDDAFAGAKNQEAVDKFKAQQKGDAIRNEATDAIGAAFDKVAKEGGLKASKWATDPKPKTMIKLTMGKKTNSTPKDSGAKDKDQETIDSTANDSFSGAKNTEAVEKFKAKQKGDVMRNEATDAISAAFDKFAKKGGLGSSKWAD